MTKRNVVILFVVTIILVTVVLSTYVLLCSPKTYHTTDIANYGKIVGNFDNERPSAFIKSFFPKEVSNAFVDVAYSYRAQKLDTYGYEAYLEFRVDDPQVFSKLIESVAESEEWNEFAYDADYMEYCIDDTLHLHKADRCKEAGYYYIEYANIGKVLYSAQTQTMIFVAIGVYDGGGTDTRFLSTFFDRFHIEPAQYAQKTD